MRVKHITYIYSIAVEDAMIFIFFALTIVGKYILALKRLLNSRKANIVAVKSLFAIIYSLRVEKYTNIANEE